VKALFFKYIRHLAPIPRHKTGHIWDTFAMVMMMKLKHVDELSGCQCAFKSDPV
jgi:hypothetical protein